MEIQTNTEIINAVIADEKIRLKIITQSHEWFFAIYFSHYIKYASAPFHKELFTLTEDDSTALNAIVAFRGSGKSTIITLSYPLWAILGQQQKKNIVIFSRTIQQSKQYLKNIKEELENNELLRRDLGPFKEEENEWNSQSLVVTNYNARITVASIEQGVRGFRHGSYRPDLIILDDIEDINSVQTQENRDKTFRWVSGDVMPLGDKNTKFIFIGNLLHEDSLLRRFKKKLETKESDGLFKF